MSKTNGTANGGRKSSSDDIPTTMSTTALENKLKHLREQSNQHSQVLTQKLASSQSGQNLLHIGTSLSTLPPDLHSLLTQTHPVLSATEQSEREQLQHLTKLVETAKQIQLEQRRVQHAKSAADLYADLCAAEQSVTRDINLRRYGKETLEPDDIQGEFNQKRELISIWF